MSTNLVHTATEYIEQNGAEATPVVLGLDLGTSGIKAVALDRAGTLRAEAGGHYPLLTPQPGWSEQDPADWWRVALEVLTNLAAQLAAQGLRPLALGLSGQMHGLVPLDAGGKVIRPAMLWNDARTGGQVTWLESRISRAELIAKTGNRAVAGFQLPKILWLREHEPQHFAVMHLALLPKDYLAYRLTGRAVTEPSDASGVGLLNLQTLSWDNELLAACELPRSLFPELIGSHEVVGPLSAEVAQQTALPAGLPVVAGAGDNAAAAVALGLGQARPTLGSLSLGTSGVIFAPLSQPAPDPQGRVHLFAHADGGFHLLGVTLAAGGALQWFRDQVAPECSIAQLIQEAASSTSGAQGLTFLPYLAGERSPWMRPELRGSWTGLSLAHRRADLVRALLEGVAFSLADTWAVMQPLCEVEILGTTGGGAGSDLWLSLCASALGLPLLSNGHTAGAAQGAALLATVAAGWSGSVSETIERYAPPATPLSLPAVDIAQAYQSYSAARAELYGLNVG